jgi:hypothetical protein
VMYVAASRSVTSSPPRGARSVVEGAVKPRLMTPTLLVGPVASP